MKRYIKNTITTYHTQVFGMAVVDKNHYNIPYDIWLDPAGNDRNMKHNIPRVKIIVDGERIPFSIDKENPHILVDKNIRHEKEIVEWIKKNYDILMKQWNREISDNEALDLLEAL